MKRVLAALTDTLILVVLCSALEPLGARWGVLLVVLYWSVQDAIFGRTPGKRLLRLVVVFTAASPTGRVAQAILRAIVRLVCLSPPLLPIWVAMAVWDRRGRSLTDRWSGSSVVPVGAEAAFARPSLALRIVAPCVALLAGVCLLSGCATVRQVSKAGRIVSQCKSIENAYARDDYFCYDYVREEHCSSFWSRAFRDRWAEVSLDLARAAAVPWHGQCPDTSRLAPPSQAHRGALPETVTREGVPVRKATFQDFEALLSAPTGPGVVLLPYTGSGFFYLAFFDEDEPPTIVLLPVPEAETHTPAWAYVWRVLAYPFAAAWDVLTLPVQLEDALRRVPLMG
jgi:uncharacterized protein YceK